MACSNPFVSSRATLSAAGSAQLMQTSDSNNHFCIFTIKNHTVWCLFSVCSVISCNISQTIPLLKPHYSYRQRQKLARWQLTCLGYAQCGQNEQLVELAIRTINSFAYIPDNKHTIWYLFSLCSVVLFNICTGIHNLKHRLSYPAR